MRKKPLTTHYKLQTQKGFTLIELLIYVAITAMVMGMFIAILITIARIQTRGASSSKTINELGFLMTEMRRLTQSAVDLNTIENNTKLELTIIATTTPATVKILAFDPVAHAILLVDDGPSGPSTSTLSSSQIRIDNLAFRNLSIGASKSVNILLTGTVSPNNETLKLTRTLESTAALYVQEP